MQLQEKHRFEDCWLWPDSVTRYVKENMEGRTLNVPCGKSQLGDVRADAEPKDDEVEKVDMRELPYDDASFDTVISDPPWKIGYHQRWKPFYECVRVTKPGGLIIYNATWVPESDQCEMEELRVRQDEAFTNASILSLHRRYPNQATFDETR